MVVLWRNVDDLKMLTSTDSLDVIFITEKWLCSQSPDQFLDLKAFTIFREDRRDGNDVHGGVLIAVKNSLNPMSVSIENNQEVCFVNCIISGTKFMLGVV